MEEGEQKKAKEAKKVPVSRENTGFVDRRVQEDAAQVHRHDGVRVCSGCGQEKAVQGYCTTCCTLTCAACCRKCPAKCERNG